MLNSSLTLFFVFFFGHQLLSLFMHTFFLHRYVTHRQFTMRAFWEKFFYVLTFIFQGPAFLDPISYAMLHLEHHAHSDTALDPHAPGYSPDIVRMMWKTKLIFVEIRNGTHRIFQLYRNRQFPRWPEFTDFANSGAAMISMSVVYIFLYWLLAPTWWCWLFLPVTLLNGPVQGAIVNWCGHKYGRRNFKELPDNSKNTPFAGLFLGELYQNNHHKNPNDPNFAKKWYEFDPTYHVIRFFALLKIIQLK